MIGPNKLYTGVLTAPISPTGTTPSPPMSTIKCPQQEARHANAKACSGPREVRITMIRRTGKLLRGTVNVWEHRYLRLHYPGPADFNIIEPAHDDTHVARFIGRQSSAARPTKLFPVAEG